MKILFCTDGSDISLNALNNALTLIPEAVIDPICVIDWSFLPTSMNIDSAGYSQAYENVADGILNFAESTILDKGYKVGNKIKVFGSAAEGILEQLDKESYDLVLIGSHGKKGIQKWLGSVSRQVISNTIVPVFVSKKKRDLKKILLTVDGSEQSLNAIREIIDVFELKDKDISIISVKENPELLPMEATMDKNWFDAIEKQQKIHASKAINKAKAILDQHNINVQNEVILTGHPAQKIIEFSDREKIDLVVLGARTKTDLSKLLLGSVSKRVLENVEADVFVVNK